MRVANVLVSAAILVGVATSGAEGMYADRAGGSDWLNRFVGVPDWAYVSSAPKSGLPDAGRFALVVSSATGCAASLSAPTKREKDSLRGRRGPYASVPGVPSAGPGSVTWRQCALDGLTGAAAAVFPGSGGGGGGGAASRGGGYLGAVGDGGRVLRVFSTRDGAPVWDDILRSELEGHAGSSAVAADPGTGAFITAAAGRIQSRDAATGKVAWTAVFPQAVADLKGSPSDAVDWRAIFVSGDYAYAVAESAKTGVFVARVGLKKGDIAALPLGRDGAASASAAAVLPPRAAGEGPAGASLFAGASDGGGAAAATIVVVRGDRAVAVTGAGADPVRVDPAHRLDAPPAPGFVGFVLGRGAGDGGERARVPFVPVDRSTGGAGVAALRATVECDDKGAGALAAPVPACVSERAGFAPYASPDRRGAVRYVSRARDDSAALMVFRDGSVVFTERPSRSGAEARSWERDEALASPVSVVLVDLPYWDDDSEAADAEVPSVADFAAMLARSARGAASAALSLVASPLGRADPDAAREHRFAADRPDALTRDRFGLRKMAVVLTATGKLFGVLTENGRVAWSAYPGSTRAPPCEGDGGAAPPLSGEDVPGRLLLTRTSMHHAHECVAVGDAGTMWRIDPLTGGVRCASAAGIRARHAAVVGEVLPGAQRPVLVADDATRRARVIGGDVAGDVSFWTLDEEAGTMRGFGVDGRNADPRWTIRVAEPSARGGRILAVTARDSQARPHDPASPRVRVTGDLGVLLRYDNPSLVAVIAEAPADAGANGAAPGVPSTAVTVTLVDTHSGVVLRRSVHHDASGPCHAVRSGNWLAYTFWNTRTVRQEVSSVELYVALPKGFHPMRSAGWVPSLDDVARRPDALLRSSQRTFILDATVRAIGMTVTQHGITLRQVVLALASGQVLGLNQKFLDPRRPDKDVAVPADAQEGLIPYNARLPINPRDVLSYNRTVEGVRVIASSPTALESTTVVYAAGIDHFCTRAAPSKLFDQLSEDFNYGILFGAIVALAIATITSRVLLDKSRVSKAWK